MAGVNLIIRSELSLDKCIDNHETIIHRQLKTSTDSLPLKNTTYYKAKCMTWKSAC
jgi:hypothetical protein